MASPTTTTTTKPNGPRRDDDTAADKLALRLGLRIVPDCPIRARRVDDTPFPNSVNGKFNRGEVESPLWTSRSDVLSRGGRHCDIFSHGHDDDDDEEGKGKGKDGDDDDNEVADPQRLPTLFDGTATPSTGGFGVFGENEDEESVGEDAQWAVYREDRDRYEFEQKGREKDEEEEGDKRELPEVGVEFGEVNWNGNGNGASEGEKE